MNQPHSLWSLAVVRVKPNPETLAGFAGVAFPAASAGAASVGVGVQAAEGRASGARSTGVSCRDAAPRSVSVPHAAELHAENDSAATFYVVRFVCLFCTF